MLFWSINIKDTDWSQNIDPSFMGISQLDQAGGTNSNYNSCLAKIYV